MAKRKRRIIAKIGFISVVCLSLAAMIVYYLTNRSLGPAFKHYDSFGINIPVNYSIHGIDVSRHQGVISWRDVRAMKDKDIVIDFAFIKATEGVGLVDAGFRRNFKNAKQAGIKAGAYHFFIGSKSGKAQAENFLETVQLQKGDLYPVLDVEQINGTPLLIFQQRVADWLAMVEAVYHVKPIIYTNADFYENFLSGRFDNYPLWVAHYLELHKPRVYRSWLFWQHNETGHVNGINTFVDFNVFNGDSVAFRGMLLP